MRAALRWSISALERFTSALENAPMTIAGWFAAVVGIVWVRMILEAFSNPDISLGFLNSSLPTTLHFVFFYLGVTTLVVVCVSAATRVSALVLMRLSVFLLPLIWLAPLIDLTYGGARIAYVFAQPATLLKDFFTFFGPLTREGATFGLRAEIAVAVIGIGVYVYLRTKKVQTAIAGGLAAYAAIFFTGVLPNLLLPASGGPLLWSETLNGSLIAHNFLHPSFQIAHRSMDVLFDVAIAQVWFVLSSVLGVVWLYQARKDMLRAAVSNIRPERVFLFIAMAVVGALVAVAAGSWVNWTIFDIFTFAAALAAFLFACVFAIATNDLVDEPIDAISNTGRPLVTGALSREMMREIALVSGSMTLAGALVLGSYAGFFLMLFTAAYYIYSVPPLRLKRIPILSSALIGIAMLAITMMGFYLVSANQAVAAFPARLALLVVLATALIANVRDLKDMKGDAVAGIWTLPTLLGERRARVVIGGMTFCAFLLIPVFVPAAVFWMVSLVAGLAAWVGIVLRGKEILIFSVFIMYLISIIALMSLP